MISTSMHLQPTHDQGCQRSGGKWEGLPEPPSIPERCGYLVASEERTIFFKGMAPDSLTMVQCIQIAQIGVSVLLN